MRLADLPALWHPLHDAGLDKLIGPAVPSAEIVEAIEHIVHVYLARQTAGERFLDAVYRFSLEPFRESVYGAA